MGSSETLRSVIDAGRSSKRLDELSSARVIGKIAMQIHAAQQKAGSGKAVGPVTPAHIALSPSGEAKLQLAEGNALGYSSPEQTMGGFGDRRSDVFSLGTVLWEALTYQRLFDAMNDAAVRMAVQEREIAQPSEINANVPAELSAICMRALNRNPTDRYQSLKAMAVEIEEFLEEAGYPDDDSKIASHLAAMHEPPKQVKIAMAPLARPASSTPPPPVVASPPEKAASGTQPPPNVLKQPAAPSMLGEAPRPKTPSGAALAAALANAGTPNPSNGSTPSAPQGGLPPASYATTAVGVPKLDEWQDSASAAHGGHAPPPAAAPVVQVEAASTAESLPMTPLPPVLPAGSAAMRVDKATIAAAVPPQVKVSTVEAKHTEAKQPATLVETKPKALIVEDKPKAELVDDGKTTLVDSKPPEVIVPKLVDGKLPEGALPAAKSNAKAVEVKPSAVETQPIAPVVPDDAKAKRAGSQSEATKRAGSQSEATKRAGSQSDAVPSSQAHVKSAPHPAGAVSLPATRESKDVLAGWGWGTDKHEAIPPDNYSDDDDYQATAPDSRKMLIKIIGAGMGAVALIIIIAFAFGGSSKKKTENTAAKQADTTRTVVDPAPPAPPEPPPAQVAAPGGSATPTAEVGSAQTAAPDPAAAAAAKAEADKQEAARLAAEQEQAKQAEAAKAEAAKQQAARIAAEQEASAETAKQQAAREAAEQKAAEQQKKQEAAEAKKQEAARIAAEKAEAKKAEAARIAAEREAKKQEAARIAAQKAEAKKAEAARIAAQKKAEPKTAPAQPKTTTQAKTTRPDTTKKVGTKVAKADTTTKADGKQDVEAAYRLGLQQFARGDTTAALASLRTSLAGNPNYAPTWRGLGLVFEKMGEKDQARAAYKRYLQLSPNAGDAEQIRSRLERLGS
ncbi:MAG TPA: tetratricopeptide repeat protein [Kofleriaceae bacterium]